MIKKKNMLSVCKDIFSHSKGECWSEPILKMGFLIKFCSSASYCRLVILSNHRLPPSTTIDNHFENKLKRIEKTLETPKELYNLLSDYWNYLKNNFLKNTENVLETLKVASCLGCDAASLTVFSSKKKYSKTKN